MDLNVFAKAVLDGDLQIVKAFVEEWKTTLSNDVTAKNINNALISTSSRGHFYIAHYLISQGADVNTRADHGSTALMWACKEGDLDIVRFLMSQWADVNAKDNYGWTALMSACKGGHLGVVDYLVTEGVDVNAKDNRGMTALMVACQEGHLDIAKFLIRRLKEADVNAENNDKQSAESLAKQAGHTDIVEYLKKNKEEYKKSVLRWANIVISSMDLPTIVDSNQIYSRDQGTTAVDKEIWSHLLILIIVVLIFIGFSWIARRRWSYARKSLKQMISISSNVYSSATIDNDVFVQNAQVDDLHKDEKSFDDEEVVNVMAMVS